MGQGVWGRCDCCGDTREFLAGIGMMYGDFETIVNSILSSSVRKQVKTVLGSFSVTSFDCSVEVYECESCDTAHSRTYFKMEYGDGQIFETKFRCGYCRKPLIKAIKPVTDYRCVKCGEYGLVKDSEILWD